MTNRGFCGAKKYWKFAFVHGSGSPAILISSLVIVIVYVFCCEASPTVAWIVSTNYLAVQNSGRKNSVAWSVTRAWDFRLSCHFLVRQLAVVADGVDAESFLRWYDVCRTIRYSFCRILDLSFNRIAKIENLRSLFRLKKLFLENNKIDKIEHVNHLTDLDMLELGSNKIRVSCDVSQRLVQPVPSSPWYQVIENLDGLDKLTALYLGKNKITKIDGLENLKELKLLSIQV